MEPEDDEDMWHLYNLIQEVSIDEVAVYSSPSNISIIRGTRFALPQSGQYPYTLIFYALENHECSDGS